MYYIFNAKGDCIGSCNLEPDANDLQTRNCFALEHNEAVSGSLKADPETRVIRSIPPAPSTYHEWDNEKNQWTISKENIQAALKANKESKLAQLNVLHHLITHKQGISGIQH